MVRRASSTLLAAFAVGALALLLAAAPAAARPPLNEFGCPPGCKTCRQMTEQEVAQLRAKWEAKMAEKQQRYAARNAAAGTSGAGGPPGGGHGGPDKQRNWLQRLSEGPVYACETCIAGGAYELKDTRCVCAAGYGWPKHDRAQGAPKTAPACEPCPAGTVSGPDAPKPDWAAIKAAWAAKRAGAAGQPAAPQATQPAAAAAPQPAAAQAAQPSGRRLFGADGSRGFGKHGALCVACPEGTKANAARTKCA